MIFKEISNVFVRYTIYLIVVTFCLLLPAYATKLIFQHGEWIAKFIVYIVIFCAICHGMKDYRIGSKIARWYQKKFKTKLI